MINYKYSLLIVLILCFSTVGCDSEITDVQVFPSPNKGKIFVSVTELQGANDPTPWWTHLSVRNQNDKTDQIPGNVITLEGRGTIKVEWFNDQSVNIILSKEIIKSQFNKIPSFKKVNGVEIRFNEWKTPTSAKCSKADVFKKAKASNAVFIKKGDFEGIEKYTVNGHSLYAVAGRYIKPINDKTLFVTIYSCKNGNIVKETAFDFYGDSLDYLRYDINKQRLYVVFVDESEMFGWIELINSKYEFTMFSDPEL